MMNLQLPKTVTFFQRFEKEKSYFLKIVRIFLLKCLLVYQKMILEAYFLLSNNRKHICLFYKYDFAFTNIIKHAADVKNPPQQEEKYTLEQWFSNRVSRHICVSGVFLVCRQQKFLRHYFDEKSCKFVI
jgi:hypothetical protein